MFAKNPAEKVQRILTDLLIYKLTNEEKQNRRIELFNELSSINFLPPLNDPYFDLNIKSEIYLTLKNFLSGETDGKSLSKLIIRLSEIETFRKGEIPPHFNLV